MKRAQFKGFVRLGNISTRSSLSEDERAINRKIDAMNGIKHYRRTYTEKQKKYIEGTVPDEKVRLGEIRQLLNKALFLEDQETFDIVSDRYDKEFFRDYKPKYTMEEAIKILEEIDKI